MSTTAPKHTLAASLERIQAMSAELRQTEALEAQIREMVTLKRHRLDSMLTDHLQLAMLSSESSEPVAVPVPAPVVALPAPPPPLPAAELPLTPHGNYGAPKDLLQGRPAPSAQHVLDSLNRLMAGIKDVSSRQANAA
jgi:hypothetical protein